MLDRLIALSLIVALGSTVSAHAAERWSARSILRGAELRDAYPAALETLKRSLAECEVDRPQDDRCLDLMLAIVVAAQRSGADADAESYARRAVALAERSLPADHADIAVATAALGAVLDRGGRQHAVEAEAVLRRAQALFDRVLPDSDTRVAVNLDRLAANLLRQGKHAEAESLFRRALARSERADPQDDGDIAISLNNLALSLSRQSRFAEAELLLRRALVLKEAVVPRDDAELAASLANLALNLTKQGMLTRAEPLNRRALALYEAALLPHDPRIATTLNNLASNLHQQGRLSEAEPLLRKALSLRETASASGVDLATSLNNLAFNLVSQGRDGEAEPLYRRMIALHAGSLGLWHPDRIGGYANLAGLYARAGRADAERRMLMQAEAGALESVRALPGATAAASAELASYRALFTRHVRAAWTLANPVVER